MSSPNFQIAPHSTESGGSPTTPTSSTVSGPTFQIVFTHGGGADDAKETASFRSGEGYHHALFGLPSFRIATGAVPSGFTQRAYAFTLQAAGGAAPFTWSVISGALPYGYSLNPSTGVISGFTDVPQLATFTVMVQDAASLTAAKTFSLRVWDRPSELVNPGLNYPYLITDHGFVADGWQEFTWPGHPSPNYHRNIVTKLESNSAQSFWKGWAPWRGGVLQHVPVVPGKPFTVNISAIMESDESGDYNVEIGAAIAHGIVTDPNAIAASDLRWDNQANLRVWNAFQATLTPTQDYVTVFLIGWNKWAFGTRVTFDAGTATQGLVKIATASLPPAVVGAPYSQSLSAVGGTPPYTWSLFSGTLPAGLTLNGSAGTITGTATAEEARTFTVRAADSAGPPQEASRFLEIATGIPPAITTHPANQTAAVGNVAMFTVAATGTAPLSYQWQRDRVDVPGAQGDAYSTGPVATADHGTKYRAIVSNFVGSVVSNEAILTVTSAPVEAPFGGVAWAVPGTIEAENFDEGGEGLAYHDMEAANLGGAYRPAEGVDVQAAGDAGGGYAVGWTRAGEYLQYTVNVAESGSYTLEARVASAGAGGTFHAEFAGVDATGPLAIPDTGGWEAWQTVVRKGVGLAAGQQIMRIAFDADGATGLVGKLNYLRITSEKKLETPFSPGMVEIHLPQDVAGLTVTPDGGSAVAMTRVTPRHAFGFIGLSTTAPTGYTVRDANNATVLASTLAWTPTNLSNKSYASDSLAMRAGDSLLLTATGAGTSLQIDGDGDGVYEHAGAPGDRFAHAYNATGVFIARAKIDGSEVGSLTVKAIAVDLGGPIACQVGFQRQRAVAVTPSTEIGSVLFEADNFTPMDLSQTGATLYLKPRARGTPAVLARVGGAGGPIAASREVEEFTVDIPARELVVVDPDTRVGGSNVDIHPFISGLHFQFDMFASQSTFTGGVISFSAHTSVDFQKFTDPISGEEAGRLFYEVETPVGENTACFNVDIIQHDGGSKPILEKSDSTVDWALRWQPVQEGTQVGRSTNINPPVVPESMYLFLWGNMQDRVHEFPDEAKRLSSVFLALNKLGYVAYTDGADYDQALIEKAFSAAEVTKNPKRYIIDKNATLGNVVKYFHRRSVRGVVWSGHGWGSPTPADPDNPKPAELRTFESAISLPADGEPEGQETRLKAMEFKRLVDLQSKRMNFTVIHACFSGGWSSKHGDPWRHAAAGFAPAALAAFGTLPKGDDLSYLTFGVCKSNSKEVVTFTGWALGGMSDVDVSVLVAIINSDP